MSCKSPLQGWLSKRLNPDTGKRSVVFSGSEALRNRPVEVPCGRCLGCMLERSRQWALRCKHEMEMHDENCFCTLTYNDEYLPSVGLVKRDLQLFMKRLREHYAEKSIRFFACGEYGEGFGRAHYHVLLFGHDFGDKYHHMVRNRYPVWRSPELEKLWPFGFSEVGSATYESAGYIARYLTKDYSAKHRCWREALGHNPEFLTMSRGGRTRSGVNLGGIGKSWYETYGEGVRKHDSIIHNGKEVRPPKFYDHMFEAVAPWKYICRKKERELAAKRARERDGRGDSRYAAESKILEARNSIFNKGSM